MFRPNQKLWVILSALFVLSAHGVAAQQATATLAGTISDETGAVLPGVDITLRNVETSATRATITDDTGQFRVGDVAPGEYELRAQLPGFQTAVRSGIKLNVGRHASLNFTLAIGSVAEEVIVTGDAALVDTLSSTVRELVDDRKIRDLPLNGRSFEQLALLQPGVVAYRGFQDRNASAQSASGNRFSVGGARPTANNFILDGTNINDTANATPGSAAGVNMGVEAIREFEILTNSFDATFGRNSGAVINVVTLSGTNEVHGTLFEFHRNSALDARNFFDRDPSDATNRSDPPEFKRNQFGFSLGGPIVQDKIFIFGNYEGFRERHHVTNIATVPSAAGRQGIGAGPQGTDLAVHPGAVPYLDLYPLPNGREFVGGIGEFLSNPLQPINEDYFVIRYDHQISEADSFFVRYTFDDGDLIIPDKILLYPEEITTRRQYITIEEKHIFSPSLLHTFRFGFNRSFRVHDDDLDFGGVDPSLSLIPGEKALGLFNFSTQVTGGPSSLTNLGPGGFARIAWNSFQVSDDVSYSSGRNSIRVGVNIERIDHNFTNATFARARYSFNSFRDFLEGKSRIFQSYIVDGNIWRGMRTTTIGVYVQDDFRWKPNLTLNLGFRYDTMTEPSEVNGLQSQLTNVLDPDVQVGKPYFDQPGHVLAPRIGLAWDMFGTGKTSLRAGYGIFNDVLTGTFWVNLAMNAKPFNGTATISGPAKDAVFPNAYSLVSGANSIVRATPDAKLPTRQHWNLTLQHELLPQTVMMVAYTGAVGHHEVRTGEANTGIPTIVDGKKFWPAGPVQGRVPDRNPNFSSILTHNTDSNSSYNSLQLSLNRKFSQGLQFQGAYTWGHSIDQGSQQWGSEGSNSPQNIMDLYDHKFDQGASTFDVQHNFVFNASYELPIGSGRQFGSNLSGLGNHLLGGWSINSIVALASGGPVTFITGSNRSRNSDQRNPDRPDLVSGASNNPTEGTSVGCTARGGPEAGTPLGTPDLWFDPCVLTLPPAGFFGDLGRSSGRGPGLAQWDFGLFKNFDVSEEVGLQFRVEFFNLTNRPNFSHPSSAVLETNNDIKGGVGRITRTVTTAREIQLALKLTF